jgi:succinoglycan biosynthesis transport protein ExoP
MQSLIERARESYDCIILDLPAVRVHVDVMAAAELLDAVVLVADWNRTTVDDMERSLAVSSVLAERLVGVIVNKSRPPVG